ncbi:uncharacterized protein LOC62_02G002697 [Vanrija pseudolonga]|uniref:Tautomerase cis-CaaD-like domain-containing protein n=1 Tax=Vanrija pseudolonga TaxID=143232 RepID=A0AAF0Y344_9TREE|nr:hypothetical protein LOC62_02G002697 [Vanrija pseudolonga]
MPTYVAKVPAGLLNAAQKLAMARAIAKRHVEASGTPKFMSQVLIDEDSPTALRFVGGEPVGEADPKGHIWIRADIKAGRPAEFKKNLMFNIINDVSQITGVRKEFVWVYLNDLLPDGVVEFGQVLYKGPEDQAGWIASLPEDIRAKLGK